MDLSHTGRTLQARWKVVEQNGAPRLLYYGVRNPPRHREQTLPISRALAARLQSLGPSETLDIASLETPLADEAQALIQQGILVAPESLRIPKTPDTMQVCVRCVTNDYVIPGLEFDGQGVCALCQCYAQAGSPSGGIFTTVAEEDLQTAARRGNGRAEYDVMLLYTGGKDSSYMLWLLARKLGLRVLAAFWNMPYCSEAAYANIRRAKERMPEVAFVEWTLPLDQVRAAMRAKWRSHGWPCLCPTAAFPLLYPLAVQAGVPYVMLGLEDIQASVVDYVFAPPAPPDGAASPPSPRDQTLGFLRTRAMARPLRPPHHWIDEMANYHAAVRQAMPGVFAPLAEWVQQAGLDPSAHVPLIVRLNTNAAYGDWNQARRIIETEMGWQAPESQNSLLHTSCAIEPVKDYLQFQRFRAMRTVFMPQSLVETGAAVYFGLTSREEALEAVRELGYWRPPDILDTLATDLGITAEDVFTSEDELGPSMAEWARKAGGANP